MAILPILLEIIWRTRNFGFPAFSRLALLWICDRGEEITRGLSRRAVPSHAFEICLCVSCWAEIDLSSLIQDYGFVAEVVDILRGLVDGDERGKASYVCAYPERANELKSGC